MHFHKAMYIFNGLDANVIDATLQVSESSPNYYE